MAAIPAIRSEVATNKGCSEKELESSTGEMAGWKGPRVPELWLSAFLEPEPDPLLVPEEPLDPDADPLLVPEEPLDPDADPLLVPEELLDPDADPLLVPDEEPPEELREPLPELLPRRPDADPLLVPDDEPPDEPPEEPPEEEEPPVEPPVEPAGEPVDDPPVVVGLVHFLGLVMTVSHSPSTSPLSSASAQVLVSTHQPQKGSLEHLAHV